MSLFNVDFLAGYFFGVGALLAWQKLRSVASRAEAAVSPPGADEGEGA